MAEQDELLDLDEAGLLGIVTHRRSDRTRPHPCVAECGDLVDPSDELVVARWCACQHDEMSSVGPEGPCPNPRGARLAVEDHGWWAAARRSAAHLAAHRANGSVVVVTVLFATHPALLDHLAGPRHPERPERLGAVIDGAARAGIGDALVALEPVAAPRDALERVHPSPHLDRLEQVSLSGGGRLDPDTYAGPASWDAARLAAGAGLVAIEALRAGRGDAAFCAVRPPGHHAAPMESMGFCMVNNVAVAAAALADAGERVLVYDFDAHHGNGTQDVFYDDPRVLFVSMHQWPLYPGSGWLTETGEGAGHGHTLNIPLPPGATGDVYLRAFDTVAAPLIDRFAPTWVVVSAGFDAHRDDPITELGLSAGDFAPLTRRVIECVPQGRRLVMLEGGYDLDALALGAATVLQVLAGVDASPLEEPTSGGPGNGAIARVREHWDLQGLT